MVFPQRPFRSPWERWATVRTLCKQKMCTLAWRPMRPLMASSGDATAVSLHSRRSHCAHLGGLSFSCTPCSRRVDAALAPVPLRLFSNVMTLHWHNVNVNKMSTLLKLRPTNAGDIVLTFSPGNRCIQTFHWTRLFSHTLLLKGTTFLCIMTSHVGVDTFPRRCFSGVSHWFSSKPETFWLNGYVYLCNLTNILCMYCDYFPSSSPEVNS